MTWAWAVVIPAFIAWVAYRITRMRDRKQLVRLLRDNPGLDPSRRLRLAEIVGDRHDIGTWPGVPPLHPVPPLVHQTPPHDAVPQVTPCCSVPVLLLPADEPFTSDAAKVTCGHGGTHRPPKPIVGTARGGAS